MVATDVSETALARARARGGTAPIVWLRDDAMRSALAGAMDVIVDRGTLHTLPPAQRASYVSGLTTRTRPGSIVILTVHTPPGDPRVRSYPMNAGELAALFDDRFETIATQAGAFAGRLSPAPACVTVVLRRR